MAQGLKQDICDIRNPSLLNIEVTDLASRIEQRIPSHLGYACRHWAAHLLEADISDNILDALVEFVEQRLLCWVEACSLLGVLRGAIIALSESQKKLTVSRSSLRISVTAL